MGWSGSVPSGVPPRRDLARRVPRGPFRYRCRPDTGVHRSISGHHRRRGNRPPDHRRVRDGVLGCRLPISPSGTHYRGGDPLRRWLMAYREHVSRRTVGPRMGGPRPRRRTVTIPSREELTSAATAALVRGSGTPFKPGGEARPRVNVFGGTAGEGTRSSGRVDSRRCGSTNRRDRGNAVWFVD